MDIAPTGALPLYCDLPVIFDDQGHNLLLSPSVLASE